ncbi:MAG: TIGR02266 family protein [Myxococcaceae bacterium]
MTSESSNEPKKVPLRIRLPFTTEAEFIERYGANVNRGGVFIATRHGKPEGTPLSFEIVLQDGTRLMRGEGVVQKLLSDDATGRSGMLVRFTRIDTRTRGLIDLIVEKRDGIKDAQPPAGSPSQPPPGSGASQKISQSGLPAVASPPKSSVSGLTPAAQPASAPASAESSASRRASQTALPAAPPPKKGPVPLADDVVIGIDLGTTTCRAAVVVEGVPRLVPVPSERGAFALPSVVAFDVVKDRILIGSSARKHRVDHPEQAVIGFKRLMGRRAQSKKVRELAKVSPYTLAADPEGDVGIELAGRVFSISEFAQHLLKELKNAAQDFLGRELSRAVLCVPAWYTDHQRAAVLQAGQLAGLEVLNVLNEPSAVALAFGYGRGLARKRVLVYDLGGGTFDASVVEITGDDLEAVSTGGDNFLGGMDFDARLADALIGTMPDAPRTQLLASRMTVERVRDAAEVTKIALSEKEKAPVHVPFATMDDQGNPVDLRVDVERGFLETATQDLVERTGQVTQVVLETAKLTPQSLDEVLLVGGQSRSPAVRRHLEKLLGRPARTDIDPAGAVALGAALLGHSLVQREKGKRGLSLAEVLSSPIGVAVKGGGFRRVLERNTRLPAEKTLALPVQAAQPLRFAVMQGMSTRAEENEYLGALSLQVERAGEVSVRFAVSADGRLTLSATTPTGKQAEVQFVTMEASEEAQARLLAESPLPGEEANRPTRSGLFTGLKKLFGSS